MEGQFTVSGAQVLAFLAFVTTVYTSTVAVLFHMLMKSKDREIDRANQHYETTKTIATDSAVAINNSARSIEMLTAALPRRDRHV